MLYTYGYYGRTADHLKNIAIEKDAIVVDCRKRPYGRQVEFNANSLRRVLGEDRYWHVPELGNVNYQNGGPIVLEDEAKGIGMIQHWLGNGVNVILLCVCKDVEVCHRKYIADRISELSGIDAEHLCCEHAKQEPAVKKVDQPGLFG
jgi:uncharacterized protein (DUF488 family)